MNLLNYTHPLPVHIEGEKTAATKHFQVGIACVWELVATPFGVTVRRHREFTDEHTQQLADLLLLLGGGWATIEKKAPPPKNLQQRPQPSAPVNQGQQPGRKK